MNTPQHTKRNGHPVTTSSESDVKYVYSFVAWPDETWGFGKAVFNLFRMLNTRVEMEFTNSEFETFRSELSHSGLTLREIDRRTYVEPESIL